MRMLQRWHSFEATLVELLIKEKQTCKRIIIG